MTKTSRGRGAAADRARSTRWMLAAVVGSLLPVAGCYSYVPTEIGAVPPGEQVQILVTRAGSEELARVQDENQLRPIVRGQFLERSADTLLLRVPVNTNDLSTRRVEIGQVVRIPEGEVLTVDRRELSVGKTAGLIAVGAGVGLFLLTQIFDVIGGDDGNGGPDPDLHLGGWSIPIG